MKVSTDPGKIYQEYLNDVDYKTAMEFTKTWPEFTRFVEGKQWPKPTEKTKYMPRPVINICDQTVENKRSNILSQQLKMQFRAKEITEETEERDEEIAQDFSDMAENTWYDLDQDTLTEEAVNDAIEIGNGILHYYFDNNIVGGTYTKYRGEIQGETIDPMDVMFGNNRLKPYQIQKQPWITIRRKRNVKDVIEEAKKHGKNADKIEADTDDTHDEQYDNAKVESKNSSEVTTFTKYYKQNGEVWYVEVTKDATIRKPQKLAPTVVIDEEDMSEPFKKYPLVHIGFKRRRKSVYYRSLIEDIIPNQKSLNWGLGMQLLSVQQTAWPKIIAKVGALTQQVTNEPGEILYDNALQGDGFKYMQMPNTPPTAMNLTQTIMEMTKNVVGVSEVSTGESIGANMAASAIIALQNQAQKPNDAYMRVIVSAIKQVGEIWECFFKSYYNIDRPIKGKDENGKKITKIFNGENGRGVEFDLMVDVGPASMYSESLQVAVLDQYADRQWIDKYKHAEYMPKNVLPQGIREQFAKEEELAQEQEEMGLNQQQLTPEEQQYLQANPQLMEGL